MSDDWLSNREAIWERGRRLPTEPPLTETELDHLEALCGVASPGPWIHKGETNPEGETWEVVTPDFAPTVIVASELSVEDAEFISAARSWVPRLVAEVRRLRS